MSGPSRDPTKRLACDFCGPRSLRDGAARNVACECAVGRAGFSVTDNHLFVECRSCGDRVSFECLEAIADDVDEHWIDGRVHDPHGLWAFYRARAWRDDSFSSGIFSARGVLQPAMTALCLNCEECELPQPSSRLPKEFIEEKVPDVEAPVTLIYVITPCTVDGDAEDIIIAEEVIKSWPLVPTDEAEKLFKGDVGTEEAYGGELCLPIASRPPSFLPFASARPARPWRLP
jgi:hypothetical protein